MRNAANGAAAASASARTSFQPGRRGNPETRKESNAKPASGTSRASTRPGDPANVTSTPRARSASATASDGATCPTVPPAAIRHRSCLCSSMTTGDVKEDADRQERDDEARASVRDERQRNPGQRGEPEHGCEVDRGLAADEGGDPHREPLSEGVLARDREPQAGVGEGRVPGHHEGCSDEPELLADHGEDHVRVRLGEVVDLVDPLPEAAAEDAAGADADLRLHVLEPGAERVLPGIEEG